jgi:Fe2+ transport system protein FeoA
LTKLSRACPGAYKFIAAYCGERLRHRLLEMGFVPGEEMSVIENSGPRGSVMIRIKGSKIALSSEVADKILLKAENNA